MPIANLSQPISVTSDQAFALTVNVATGDAYSNEPAELASGDGWAVIPGVSPVGVPVGLQDGSLTATFSAALLAELIGTVQVALRWVDESGAPGQLQFQLIVAAGLAPGMTSPAPSGQTVNIFVGATANCSVEVVMYPAGPAGPGAAVASGVALSAAAKAALAALGVNASSVDDAILALAGKVVSGPTPSSGGALKLASGGYLRLASGGRLLLAA